MAGWRIRTLALTLTAGALLAGCSAQTGGEPLGAAKSTTSASPTTRPSFAGTTLAAGDVLKVNNLNGARMQPVDGGEVRAFQLSAKVLEFGTADQISDGSRGYRAPEGGSLIAFRTTVTVSNSARDLEGQVVSSVSVDGTQRSLPDFVAPKGSTKTNSYIVAVPEQRRTVDLELKSAGVVQQFDLLEGKPKGERPAALYRPASGTVLVQEALTPATFEVAPRKGEFTTTYTATVARAEFGYFSPKSGAAASAPDKGWLTFSGTSRTQSGETCVVPLAVYKLIDDQGTSYQPAVAQSDIPAQPPIIGPVQFGLAFEVPAELKRATLSIAPTQVVCQVSTATFQTVPARGEAKVSITLPEK